MLGWTKVSINQSFSVHTKQRVGFKYRKKNIKVAAVAIVAGEAAA